MTPTAIQQRLIKLGFDLGPTGADGVWGRRSIAGLKLFQGSHGLNPNGVASRATLALLFPDEADLAELSGKAIVPVPLWYAEAKRLMGTRETAGAKSNPVILGWAKALGGFAARYYRDDAIPWCGLFVAHCIGATLPDEVLPANPLSALAWNTFGEDLLVGKGLVRASRVGAVCVFKRTGGGHVGFYVGEDADAIHVLGGNQSDNVTIARVAKTRLVGMRWPKTAPAPAPGGARVLEARGQLSANEA